MTLMAVIENGEPWKDLLRRFGHACQISGISDSFQYFYILHWILGCLILNARMEDWVLQHEFNLVQDGPALLRLEMFPEPWMCACDWYSLCFMLLSVLQCCSSVTVKSVLKFWRNNLLMRKNMWKIKNETKL